jgi:hypothetical protein
MQIDPGDRITPRAWDRKCQNRMARSDSMARATCKRCRSFAEISPDKLRKNMRHRGEQVMNPKTFAIPLLAGMLAGGAAQGLSGYLERSGLKDDPLAAAVAAQSGSDGEAAAKSAALDKAGLR